VKIFVFAKVFEKIFVSAKIVGFMKVFAKIVGLANILYGWVQGSGYNTCTGKYWIIYAQGAQKINK
jgi:hypothetical protein